MNQENACKFFIYCLIIVFNGVCSLHQYTILSVKHLLLLPHQCTMMLQCPAFHCITIDLLSAYRTPTKTYKYTWVRHPKKGEAVKGTTVVVTDYLLVACLQSQCIHERQKRVMDDVHILTPSIMYLLFCVTLRKKNFTNSYVFILAQTATADRKTLRYCKSGIVIKVRFDGMILICFEERTQIFTYTTPTTHH